MRSAAAAAYGQIGIGQRDPRRVAEAHQIVGGGCALAACAQNEIGNTCRLQSFLAGPPNSSSNLRRRRASSSASRRLSCVGLQHARGVLLHLGIGVGQLLGLGARHLQDLAVPQQVHRLARLKGTPSGRCRRRLSSTVSTKRSSVMPDSSDLPSVGILGQQPPQDRSPSRSRCASETVQISIFHQVRAFESDGDGWQVA